MSDDSSDGMVLSDFPSLSKRFSEILSYSLKQRLFSPKAPQISFDGIDCIHCTFLFWLGIVSRVIRIQYPKVVVWKEGLFGRLANNYIQGSFFDRISPSFPLLFLAWIAQFTGYRSEYGFSAGGEYTTMRYTDLRLISAFFGALCVPLSYLSLRCMSVSRLASLCCTTIIAADLLMISQARYFATNSLFHCTTIFALISIYLFEQFGSFVFFLVEGVLLGLSSDSAHFGLLLFALFRQWPLGESLRSFKQKCGIALVRSSLLILIFLVVRFAIYSVHLAVLRYGIHSNLPPAIVDCLVFDRTLNFSESCRAGFIERSIVLARHNGFVERIVESNVDLSWENGERKLIFVRNRIMEFVVFGTLGFGILRICLTRDFASDASAVLQAFLFSFFNEFDLFHNVLSHLFGVLHLVILVDQIKSEHLKGFLLYALIHLAVFGFIAGNSFVYGRTDRNGDFFFKYVKR